MSDPVRMDPVRVDPVVTAAGRRWLLYGGAGSTAVALLHIGVIVVGPAAYRYFGAPELAPLAASGSPVPALITAGLVVLFGIWALYAFSGAGLVRHLPLLGPVLVVIASVYTLRGLLLVPELVSVLTGRHPTPRMAAFSAASLAIGLCHIAGLWRGRRRPPA